MAYGGFNTGSGASSYDLDRLAAEIIGGQVSAPLMTADGVIIATRNDDEIMAYYSRAVELQEIYAAISAAKEEFLTGMYNLAADIIRGKVSAPLTTNDEIPIHDRNGTSMFAYRVS